VKQESPAKLASASESQSQTIRLSWLAHPLPIFRKQDVRASARESQHKRAKRASASESQHKLYQASGDCLLGMLRGQIY